MYGKTKNVPSSYIVKKSSSSSSTCVRKGWRPPERILSLSYILFSFPCPFPILLSVYIFTLIENQSFCMYVYTFYGFQWCNTVCKSFVHSTRLIMPKSISQCDLFHPPILSHSVSLPTLTDSVLHRGNFKRPSWLCFSSQMRADQPVLKPSFPSSSFPSCWVLK